MKKVLCMCVAIVLMLGVAACGRTEDTVEPNDDIDEVGVTNIEYAQQLSDAVIAYYLGRPYDSVYDSVLYGLDVKDSNISTGDEVVILDESVGAVIQENLYKVQNIAQVIPGENGYKQPDYTEGSLDEPDWVFMTNTELAAEYKAGMNLPEDVVEELFDYGLLSGEDYHENTGDPGTYTDGRQAKKSQTSVSQTPVQVTLTEEENALKAVFFPDGFAPAILIFDETWLNATPDFYSWFLDTAKKQGMIDSRIFEVEDGVWGIYMSECTPEKGGNNIKVFGNSYQVDIASDSVLGQGVVKEAYSSFDSGFYTSSYVTDSSRIEISFWHQAETEGEYETDLEQYLAGISELHVFIR